MTERVQELENRMKLLEKQRVKRQIEDVYGLTGDGVQIVDESYGSDGKKTTEGLRIYDAWFQNAESIPKTRRKKHKNGKAIRPHHR